MGLTNLDSKRGERQSARNLIRLHPNVLSHVWYVDAFKHHYKASKYRIR